MIIKKIRHNLWKSLLLLFVCTSLYFFWNYKFEKLYLVIDIENNLTDLNGQNFGEFFRRNHGQHFGDIDPVNFSINKGPTVIEIPMDTVSIRIDPGILISRAKVKQLDLIDDNHNLVRRWLEPSNYTDWIPNTQIGHLNFANSQLEMDVTGNDPNLVIYDLWSSELGLKRKSLLPFMISIVGVLCLILYKIYHSNFLLNFAIDKKRPPPSINFKKIIFVSIIFLISWGLILMLWRFIQMPYHNPFHIIGIVDKIKMNPSLNILRFCLFVFSPSLIYFLLVKYYPQFAIFLSNPQTNSSDSYKLLLIAKCIVFTTFGLILVEALPRHMYILDLLHDGDFLAPAFKWSITGAIWTGSFFTRGAIYDGLMPLLAWKTFGGVSIASFILVKTFLSFATGILFCLVIYSIFLIIKKRGSYFQAFLFSVVFLMVFTVFQDSLFYFDFRFLIPFLGLSIFILGSAFNKPECFLISGFITLLIPSLDLQIYYFAAVIAGLSYSLIFSEELKTILKNEVRPFSVGLIIGIMLLFVVIPTSEYKAFIDQHIQTISNWPFIYNIEFPSPANFSFFSQSWYLWAFSLLTFYFLVLFFSLERRSLLTKIYFLLLFFSLICFNSGISRADINHAIIFGQMIFFPLIYLIWDVLRRTNRRFQIMATSVFLLIILFNFVDKFNLPYWQKIPQRINFLYAHANQDDSSFIDRSDNEFLNSVGPFFENEKCIFVFSNAPALYYLFKKPACGRFYFTAHGLGDELEQEQIRDLEKTNWIIESSKNEYEIDGITNRERLPILSKKIEAEFRSFKKIGTWTILKRLTKDAE